MSRRTLRTLQYLLVLASLGAGPAAGESLPDPTRPPQATAVPARAAQPTYRLSSVMIGANRRLAVVNDQTVAEGDRIDGARVIAVFAGGVRLERAGRQFTLDLLPRAFKRRAGTGQ